MIPNGNRPRLNASRDLEPGAAVVLVANSRRLDSGPNFESRAAVILIANATSLHARVDLDTRVLRRRLHGDVPFVFR